MKIDVVSTGRPYGPAEQIPESAWSRVSTHSTLSAARKALIAYTGEMQMACGQNAWNDHYALRSRKNIPMVSQVACKGRDSETIQCGNRTTHNWTWTAGSLLYESELAAEIEYVCDECRASTTETEEK